MAALLGDSGAFGGLLYVLPPGGDALWLVMVAGIPQEFAAPWRRVALTDPMPVADAVHERRLVWIAGQEDMTRRYPRPALVLPYDFTLSAAPVASGTALQGGLVLLLPGERPPQPSTQERDIIETGCRRLGTLLQQAADRDDPLLSAGRPRTLPPPAGPAASSAEEAAASAFADRLPGGSCGLDINGRITFITRAGADLVGADRADLVGSLPWEVLPWTDVPQVEDRYRAALVSRRPQAFTVLRPPDVWLDFELYPDASGISVRIARGDPSGDAPPPRSVAAAGPSRASVLYHLMHLAATLTEAAGVQDVVEQTADQLLPALGAQGMVLMAAEDGRLRVLGHRGYRARLVDRFDAVPLSSDIPGSKVLTTGVPDFFADFAGLRRAYPLTVHEDGMASWAFLPLIASGRPIGSLLLAYSRPRLFPPAERAVLTSLAGLVGQALDRARLYDAKHRLARRLQSDLLPRAAPGRRSEGRRPLSARCPGPGHRRRLLRPDPPRRAHRRRHHRRRAGSQRGRRGAHGAGPHRRPRPRHRGRLPRPRAGRRQPSAHRPGPRPVTSCVYVHLDLATHRAGLATAGHPPPLLRHADGRTELIDVPPGLLLGIAPDVLYPTREFPLPPGCVLALYTDGLVEAPGVDLDDATAALAGLLEDTDPTDLDAMADALMRHAPSPDDDIALLLIGIGE